MKTLVVIDETAQIGGVEINLLRLLPRLQDAGWKTLLLIPAAGPLFEKLEASGVTCRVVRGGPFYSLSSYVGPGVKVPNPLAWAATLRRGLQWQAALNAELREIRPDLVQTVSMLAHVFGGRAARQAGLPVVFHVQDIVAHNSAAGLYRAIFQRLAGRLPVRIAAISPLVQRQFDANERARQRTRLIWNMVDLDKLRPSDTVPSAVCVRIGTVARLTRWKGQHVAMEVARQLKLNGVRFRWEFLGDASLGDGHYAGELEARIVEWRLEKEVCLAGWVEDMEQCYRSLDLLVHLPLEPEPSGLAIAEALACGLGVIATHGGLDAIVQEAGGVIVPAGDVQSPVKAVTQVIAWSTEQRTDQRRKARAAAEKYFSPDAIIPQWLELYEDARAVYAGARI